MPDSEELFFKFAQIDAVERMQRDTLEAISEIRYEGMDGIAAEMSQLLGDIADNKRKIREACDAALKREQEQDGTGRPAVDWR
jgi:hypothetical protein